MKKSKRLILGLGTATLLLVGFIGCTEKAVSKAQFIFKPAPSEKVVAKILGKEITENELYEGIESQLYEAQMKVFEIKYSKLQALVLKKFMEADPKFKGMSNDDFLEKVIAKSINVTDKMINDFIKERSIPKESVNDTLKERIKQLLEREEKHKAIDKWVAEKTQKNPVEVYISKPERPVFEVATAGAPLMGAVDAKVTLVEFSDFQCPYCAKGSEIIHELKKKYGKKLKVAFKNFPLPFHTNAKIASHAALCVHEQDKDKFWKMHDLMFKDQQGLASDGLMAKAKSLGVNMDKFNECQSSNKFNGKIDQDIEDGKKAGVQSTPTFFVNGKMVMGAQAVEVFSELIDEELAK